MRIATLLAGALLAAPALAAPPTAFEDFEAIAPKDTPLATLSTAVGTFTALAGVPFHNVWVSSPGYPNYGPGLNPTTSSILTSNGDERWWLDLAFPARKFAVDLYLNDLGPAKISFYDAGGGLLGSFSLAADADATNNLVAVFFTSTKPIARVHWDSTNGGTLNTGWDNVFISGVIPEPATWALLIAGFGLVGARLRRSQMRPASGLEGSA